MGNRIEVLRSNRRQDRELHTFIYAVRISNVVRSAIDRHVVAARCKTSRKLFGESLEPAVIRRDAAGSQDGQFHRAAIIDYAFRPCRTRSISSAKWFRWNRRALTNNSPIGSLNSPARSFARLAATWISSPQR